MRVACTQPSAASSLAPVTGRTGAPAVLSGQRSAVRHRVSCDARCAMRDARCAPADGGSSSAQSAGAGAELSAEPEPAHSRGQEAGEAGECEQ